MTDQQNHSVDNDETLEQTSTSVINRERWEPSRAVASLDRKERPNREGNMLDGRVSLKKWAAVTFAKRIFCRKVLCYPIWRIAMRRFRLASRPSASTIETLEDQEMSMPQELKACKPWARCPNPSLLLSSCSRSCGVHLSDSQRLPLRPCGRP